MARVVCLASPKGGSGKTTLTATFARFLNELGHSVLIVDCDEATNGLTLMHVDVVAEFPEKYSRDRSTFLGIFDTPESNYSLIEIESNLFLCPATYSFTKKPVQDFQQFKSKLVSLADVERNTFDFILLDAQAGSDPVSLAAMDSDVSDFVIVVSEYDPLSAAGVERLKAIAGPSLAYDRYWLLYNKMLPEFITSFSEFLSISHHLPPIPWNADVVRAYANKRLAIDFDKGNEFTLCVMQTLKSFPIPDLDKQLHKWSDQQASALREPISQQYSDLEQMLAGVDTQIESIERKNERKSSITKFISTQLVALPLILAATSLIFPSESIFKVAELSPLRIFGIALAGLIFLVFIFYLIRQLIIRSDADMEEQILLARLQRQRKVYSGRLIELEHVQAADYGELISSGVMYRNMLPKSEI